MPLRGAASDTLANFRGFAEWILKNFTIKERVSIVSTQRGILCMELDEGEYISQERMDHCSKAFRISVFFPMKSDEFMKS